MKVPEIKILLRMDAFTDTPRYVYHHEAVLLGNRQLRENGETAKVTVEGVTGQIAERDPQAEYTRMARRYGQKAMQDTFGGFGTGNFDACMKKGADIYMKDAQAKAKQTAKAQPAQEAQAA